MGTSFSIAPRADKAAQLLSVSVSEVLSALSDEGVTDDVKGFALLEAASTTVEDLSAMLIVRFPEAKKIPVKAAAAALKGTDMASKEPTSSQFLPVVGSEQTMAALKMMRPIQQWEDRLLLEQFAVAREVEVEQELDRRAQRNKFIVLKPGKYEAGKEEIDLEKSLELLKVARKRTTPGTIPNGSIFSLVYRVTELNPADRVIEMCPICGETMYQGYCEKCQASFAGMDDDARAYVRLVSESASFNPQSFSDRKAVIASALKGVEDLRNTWPSIAQTFDDLKLTNSLPMLRVIQTRPPTAVADPYHVGGVRISGNRSF